MIAAAWPFIGACACMPRMCVLTCTGLAAGFAVFVVVNGGIVVSEKSSTEQPTLYILGRRPIGPCCCVPRTHVLLLARLYRRVYVCAHTAALLGQPYVISCTVNMSCPLSSSLLTAVRATTRCMAWRRCRCCSCRSALVHLRAPILIGRQPTRHVLLVEKHLPRAPHCQVCYWCRRCFLWIYARASTDSVPCPLGGCSPAGHSLGCRPHTS